MYLSWAIRSIIIYLNDEISVFTSFLQGFSYTDGLVIL